MYHENTRSRIGYFATYNEINLEFFFLLKIFITLNCFYFKRTITAVAWYVNLCGQILSQKKQQTKNPEKTKTNNDGTSIETISQITVFSVVLNMCGLCFVMYQNFECIKCEH